MDAGYIDEDGYIFVTARDDDVINVAGHRLSTSALEDVILAHPDIVDATVIGVPEVTKGEIPLCLFVVKKSELIEYIFRLKLSDCSFKNVFLQSVVLNLKIIQLEKFCDQKFDVMNTY